MSIGGFFPKAYWKSKKEKEFTVSLAIGKEIPYPNTIEHHSEWIQLFFKPEKVSFPYEVGEFDFRGHGASFKGANQGPH